jgi:hypothetical protein
MIKKLLPFKDYIVIRPEALSSFYVDGKKSLVPDLFSYFKDHDVNVVYLPREQSEMKFAEQFDVFVPHEPLHGLDLCYFADAVLTGSGTMGREAAVMGKPAVSYFPNSSLISVDQRLIEEGRLFHSRKADEIGDYVLTHMKQSRSPHVSHAKKVKAEVVDIIKEILT